MDLNLTFGLLLGTIGCLCLYLKYVFSYWQRKGFPYVQPQIPYGNMKGAASKINTALAVDKLYQELKDRGPIAGIYLLTSPIALATSIETIKHILIKDFQYFQERGIYNNERDDPLSAHLFSLEGDRWRRLRHKLTPTFTSGKMKFMFPTVVDVGKRLESLLNECIDTSKDIEIKDPLARYSTDVIGSCAFGIACNSIENPNAEFRMMGKKVLDEFQPLVRLFISTFQDLARKLRFTINSKEVNDFFLGIVRETVGYREANNVHRNDFMDILINLRKSATNSLTMNEIAAQAFIFFLAGFETSSTTLTFTLYELAKHPDIQERARNEIEAAIEKHGGFTYEAMMDMPYIDQIINETLRIYPPVPNLVRKATADYKVPNTNQVIQKGTLVFIPAYSIQRDPQYYPEPEKFMSERFSAKELANRENVTFLPFGEGPRNCVGIRFGLMQTRVGLVSVLRNFELSTCSETLTPMKFKAKSIVLTPDGGLWLNFKKL